MNKTQKGARGEALALRYLIHKGYHLVAQNVRMNRKEIDIVMRDGACTVFIEVKARSSNLFGSPAEAVDRRKQAALIVAASLYMQKYHIGAARFDVVEIDLQRGDVRHIQNAFMA
ncbi:MAG: YraN family protein [Clostridiales bacterium]|nr:YraN family protein [Clostridiales bacterium]